MSLPLWGVETIELAYQPGVSTQEWLLSLLRALPWIETSSAAFAYEVNISNVSSPQIGMHASLFGSCDAEWVAAGHRFLLQHNDLWRLYRRRVTTAQTTFGSKHPVVSRFLASSGIRDGAVVFALDARGVGAVLSTQSASTYQLNSKDRYIYVRLASHIAAAARLRGEFGASPTLDHAEAVLSPEGRVLHAANDAKTATRRSLLRAFVRKLDRARGIAVRKNDSEEALNAWTSLLDGKWSMVDHFDSDGRRYCMFLKNDPRLGEIHPLTLQQRQVIGLAALGVPNKLIAYEVGISEAGVSQALRAGMRRLGFTRRTELVRVLGPLAEAVRNKDNSNGQ